MDEYDDIEVANIRSAVSPGDSVRGRQHDRRTAVNTAKAQRPARFQRVVLTKPDGDTRGGAALSLNNAPTN